MVENWYPNAQRTSLVTPLPKIAQPAEYKHLRPISILSFFSQLFEKIMYTEIISDVCRKFCQILSLVSEKIMHIVDDILQASDDGKNSVDFLRLH